MQQLSIKKENIALKAAEIEHVREAAEAQERAHQNESAGDIKTT